MTYGLLPSRRVVISGAAHPDGIGRAIANRFVDEGAHVVCIDIALPPATQEERQGLHYLQASVSSEAECAQAVSEASRLLGGIDVLVNNAGIVSATPVESMSEEEFQRMLDINLTGMFRLTKAAHAHLRASAAVPRVINMASMSASRGGGLLGGVHYASSKGGVISFTKALAREWGGAGIRVNAIAPGIISTPMTDGKFPPGTEAALRAAVPLGRFGSPQDVAGCALFLASSLSDYCTGTVIEVNGGFHIH